MALRIYNSLTKKKEEFVPLKDKTVRMYVCGVTVYDRCHIGHARSLYIFDVIRKYLQYRGYDVHFVRNITDIDDKIINKAQELGISSEEVATKNIEDYYRDLELLKIDKADIEPRATDNIPDMIKHIQGLIGSGFAYEASGSVYFSVRKFKKYGKLSGQSVKHMLEAVRVEKDENKDDPLDFALWKRSAEDEPFWESPWGKGRPGWHMECSVMSMKHLKTQTLDIHAGGRDLIFPHHENEIAQSEALTDEKFAKYWIHHGLLTINGQKMAKSLGNFITIQDAVSKYGADTLKMFFLSSHYGSPVDFTVEKMEEARKVLQRFEIFFKEADMLRRDDLVIPGEREDFIKAHEEAFYGAMDDDFNTPKALGILFELLNETYKHKGNRNYAGIMHQVNTFIQDLGRKIFGLFQPEVDLADALKGLLEERAAARKRKDFQRSDELRDELLNQGIIIEDTAQGQRWRKA